MEVISGVTAEAVNHPTTRPSPPVGDSWTDSMEGAIGVATHHDGMSGTERQDVSDDYSQRISEGHFEVEDGVAMSLQKLTGACGNGSWSLYFFFIFSAAFTLQLNCSYSQSTSFALRARRHHRGDRPLQLQRRGQLPEHVGLCLHHRRRLLHRHRLEPAGPGGTCR
eukprot:SAG22_NODE_7698_length_716_cov_1.220421_1_plen_165_part_10